MQASAVVYRLFSIIGFVHEGCLMVRLTWFGIAVCPVVQDGNAQDAADTEELTAAQEALSTVQGLLQ